MSLHLLHSPWLSHLGASLLHSFWQATVVWLLLSALLLALRKASATARHRLVLAALTFTLLLPVGTVVWLARETTATAEVSRPSVDVIASLPVPVSEHAPAVSPKPEPAPILPRPLPKPEPAPLAWQALIAVIWAAGVAVLTLRLAAGWWLMHRLRHDASRCTAPWLPGLLERTAIPAARVLCSARLHVPMVLGWFRPAIYLPAAMFGRMTLAAAETVVLHELAHLRRRDPLINLWITTVETLLFFNPPVRAMARTARDEAECACDDQVLAWGGDRPTYARALADLESASPEHLTLSLAATGSGGLLQRLHRILGTTPPQGRPFVSQTIGLATLASITGFILVCALAVPPLARAFTPEERIAALAAFEQQLPKDEARQWKAYGTLIGEDGLPLQGKMNFCVRTWSPGRSTFSSENSPQKFDVTGYGQSTRATVWLEGYAPASTTVPAPEGHSTVREFTLPLKVGFPAEVRVEDENGTPVDGAEVRVQVLLGYNDQFFRQGSLSTGANGECTIGNAATDTLFEIEIRAHGHEWREFKEVQFQPGKPTKLVTPKAPPLLLQVADARTGAAIKGASAYCCSWTLADESMSYGSRSILARLSSESTEVDGLLKIDLWSPNRSFLALVEAPGYAKAIVRIVPNRPVEPIRLQPELKLAGTIHDPERILTRIGNPPVIRYYLDSKSGNSWRLVNFNLEFEAKGSLEGNVIHFSIDQLNAGEIELSCNGHQWKTHLTENKGGLRLHLSEDGLSVENPAKSPAPPPKDRTVRFQLRPPPGQPQAQGNFIVRIRGQDRAFPISHGEATAHLKVGDYVTFIRRGIAGYSWNKNLQDFLVEDSPEDLVLGIDLLPSGGIVGEIHSSSRGRINDQLSGSILRLNNGGTVASRFGDDVQLIQESSRFGATGLPLDAQYRVLFRKGCRLVESPWITLDARNPLPEVRLDLPPGQVIQGQALDADGKPASLVKLTLVYSLRGWDYWYASVGSSADGLFTLEGINFDVEGTYSIHTSDERGRAHSATPISKSDKMIIVRPQ